MQLLVDVAIDAFDIKSGDVSGTRAEPKPVQRMNRTVRAGQITDLAHAQSLQSLSTRADQSEYARAPPGHRLAQLSAAGTFLCQRGSPFAGGPFNLAGDAVEDVEFARGQAAAAEDFPERKHDVVGIVSGQKADLH